MRDTLKTNVKSVRFVQVFLPTLTRVFWPFAENNPQSTAFYKDKQRNEVENCQRNKSMVGERLEEQNLHHRHTPALTALVSHQR